MLGPCPRSKDPQVLVCQALSRFSTNPWHPGTMGHPTLVSPLVSRRVTARTLFFLTQSPWVLFTAVKCHPLHHHLPASCSRAHWTLQNHTAVPSHPLQPALGPGGWLPVTGRVLYPWLPAGRLPRAPAAARGRSQVEHGFPSCVPHLPMAQVTTAAPTPQACVVTALLIPLTSP